MLVEDDDGEEDDVTVVTPNMTHANKIESTGNTAAYEAGPPVRIPNNPTTPTNTGLRVQIPISNVPTTRAKPWARLV